MKVVWVGLICLMAPLVLKAEERASKYRQECALTSQEFKGNLPSNFTSVWCANDKRRDFGEMGSDVVHAMAVAAFYEKRMDRRLAAMNLLESYTCKTREECKEFHHLLDWGIKSGHPRRYSAELADRANQLRVRIADKVKALE
ncbi:MAG: hypothetical protein IT288_17900 [Bdellovibrionales bacterium]|nr:hypothetical protein [Bdellovibrionales bacterium]